MTQLIDLVVNHRILLDEGIGDRQVRLRLIVVVVADEVFNGIVREKRLKLFIELCRQGLVVGNDQRRAFDRSDDVRHSKGLARTCYPQEYLVRPVLQAPVNQLPDRLGLIALWLIVADELEIRHGQGSQEPAPWRSPPTSRGRYLLHEMSLCGEWDMEGPPQATAAARARTEASFFIGQ